MSGSENGSTGRTASGGSPTAFLMSQPVDEPASAPNPPPPRGHPASGNWQLRSYLELGALPSAVPCARLHVRHILREWGLAEYCESLELVVSELSTNAVRVSRNLARMLPIRLWLVSDDVRVIVTVWDASPESPQRKDVRDDAEAGRGLMLVEAVSTQWGWYTPEVIGGKCVWAELRLCG